MYRTLSRLIVATLLLLMMAACGGSGLEGPSNFVVPDVRTSVDGEGEVFGVVMAMIDPAVFSTSLSAAPKLGPDEFSSQSMTDIGDGVYLGQLADVDSSGNTTLHLPQSDDIPSSTLVNVTDAFLFVNAAPACSVAAEPSSVEMSANLFELTAIPGFLALISTPSSTASLANAVLSDQFLDLDVPPGEVRVYQWIFSEGATTLSFEGSDCQGISASQVEFRAGWNLLAWDLDTAVPEAALTNVERPETFFMTIRGEATGP